MTVDVRKLRDDLEAEAAQEDIAEAEKYINSLVAGNKTAKYCLDLLNTHIKGNRNFNSLTDIEQALVTALRDYLDKT